MWMILLFIGSIVYLFSDLNQEFVNLPQCCVVVFPRDGSVIWSCSDSSGLLAK